MPPEFFCMFVETLGLIPREEATLQLGVFSILIKDSEKECLRVGACIKYALMIRRALFESFQPQVTLFYPQIRKEIKNKKGKF